MNISVSTRATSMTAGRGEPMIRVAAAISPDWLQTTERVVCRFDRERQAVIEEAQRCHGALILHRRHRQSPSDPARAAALLAEAAAADPSRALTMTDAVTDWLTRLRWLAHALPDLALPTFTDLSPLIAEWSVGRSSFAALRRLDLLRELSARLSWPQQEAVRKEAPSHYVLPTGRQVRIRYETPGRPPPHTYSARALADAHPLSSRRRCSRRYRASALVLKGRERLGARARRFRDARQRDGQQHQRAPGDHLNANPKAERAGTYPVGQQETRQPRTRHHKQGLSWEFRGPAAAPESGLDRRWLKDEPFWRAPGALAPCVMSHSN